MILITLALSTVEFDVETPSNWRVLLRRKATVKFIYDTEDGETSREDPYYGPFFFFLVAQKKCCYAYRPGGAGYVGLLFRERALPTKTPGGVRHWRYRGWVGI